MKSIKLSLVILLSVISLFTFAQQTTSISQQELLALMATPSKQTVILDVRSAEEFSEGHIQGAINISHEQINANLNKIIAFKDKTVVVDFKTGEKTNIRASFKVNNLFNQAFQSIAYRPMPGRNYLLSIHFKFN